MQFFNLAFWSSAFFAVAQAAPNPLQFDLSVNVKDGSSLNQGDICLRVCWPETPTCPDGWYSNNLGSGDSPCWTCCKAPYDAQMKPKQAVQAVKPKAPKREEVVVNDICLMVCWPETPTCPDGWYSNNLGTKYEVCWTCCKAPSLFVAQHEI